MTKNPTHKSEVIRPEIITVKELVTTKNVEIPKYQRPYRWSSKNVNQLLDDILLFKDKPAYRLGTVVYHLNDDQILNIVDGQQRSITLLLIGLAIQNNDVLTVKLKESKIELPNLDIIGKLYFTNNLSKNNIRDNYLEIQRRVSDFDVETVQFFYSSCEVVKVVLTDISEAFQFFDSQNARGVDLEPHDLLKAFHLREMMSNTSEDERIRIVDNWENMELEQLKRTFSNYLYRIKNWANSKSARKFTKNDVDIFKGISPSVREPFPFASIYRISHFYVESYNDDFNRKIDKNYMSYPFQLDQVLINGKRFFEMINHYVEVIEVLRIETRESSLAKEILETIDNYDGKNRTGDKYVRNLFNCGLIFYIDKFGTAEIERAIERIFIWAYSVRLTYYSVQLASVDNYALAYPHVFKTIKDALKPNDFLNLKIDILSENDIVESSKTKDIQTLFTKMNYIYA
ncbi:DUF262 domain-containing protein [Leeuwenhoekiella aequorea]|uniref:Uncharacterized protein n=1 Tax=Leeuwenhoekiella aequorea TaxID=283736 RepID=A0A4V1KQM4_9FLAO|nr:DUF262 domain-containing protein [Leeuwenhoekiella aequorea]RXG21922.1 putative protein DUF262 [Leeuwenhoekiella aequorea]